MPAAVGLLFDVSVELGILRFVVEQFLIYLFLRIAGVSYGRFIAVLFGFNLSTYVQNRW